MDVFIYSIIIIMKIIIKSNYKNYINKEKSLILLTREVFQSNIFYFYNNNYYFIIMHFFNNN